MRLWPLFLLLATVKSYAGAAVPVKIALVISDPTASGSHPVEKTMGQTFITSLRNVLASFDRSVLLYDGSLDTKDPASKIPDDALPTLANATREINKLKNDIDSGAIKGGDEVFVYLNLHGMETASGKAAKLPGSTTHCDFLNGSCFDLDLLKPLADSAFAHDVNVVIFDGACFSGASQPLANSNTCIVSAAQWYEPGAAEFPMKLIESIKPGMSMEDVYLDSRRDYAFAFPVISGVAGETTDVLLQSYGTERVAFADDKDSLAFFSNSNSLDPYFELSPSSRLQLGDCVQAEKLKSTESCIRKILNLLVSKSPQIEDQDLDKFWRALLESETYALDPKSHWWLPENFRPQERAGKLPRLERPVYDKLYEHFRASHPESACSKFHF